MNFSKFIKNYFSNWQAVLFRCLLVSAVIATMNFRKGHLLMTLGCFVLAFVVYMFVDVALEWMKVWKNK
ncbi:MAG: hypothetical protein IKK69_07505 [Firmicutes bacterium]|nr:hypothetical protein [Bacillota bacterium]